MHIHDPVFDPTASPSEGGGANSVTLSATEGHAIETLLEALVGTNAAIVSLKDLI